MPAQATGHVDLEVCVQGAPGAVVADRAGADRVELCQALIVGGLTPSIGTVVSALHATEHVRVCVLIRPRDGDFVFSATEVRAMITDIVAVRREAEAADRQIGLVLGALTEQGELDRAVLRDLAAACGDVPMTAHRAIDLTPDLDRSLDTLIELGFVRVLTAGGMQRAAEGVATLARLVGRAAGRIDVMPGGSVRAHNAVQIVAATGVRDLHFRAAAPYPNVAPQRTGVRLTAPHPPDEATREETSPHQIWEMRAAVDADGSVAPV